MTTEQGRAGSGQARSDGDGPGMADQPGFPHMLRYVSYGIFDSPADALVNPVNTSGVMGAGLALAFRQRYPAMFAEYRRMCLRGRLRPGALHIWRGPEKTIVNLPTKADWRLPSRLEYIEAGLAAFSATWREYGISSVSFPRLGCGRGGLDWESQVRPLMERYLCDLPISVLIHLYP